MLQPWRSAMPVRSTSEKLGKGIDEMRTWFHAVSTKLSPLSTANYLHLIHERIGGLLERKT